MKKILFAIALFAVILCGCNDQKMTQSVAVHVSTDGFGYFVAQDINIPKHLSLTNTVYEITQTNATVTFSFGIKDTKNEKQQ